MRTKNSYESSVRRFWSAQRVEERESTRDERQRLRSFHVSHDLLDEPLLDREARKPQPALRLAKVMFATPDSASTSAEEAGDLRALVQRENCDAGLSHFSNFKTSIVCWCSAGEKDTPYSSAKRPRSIVSCQRLACGLRLAANSFGVPAGLTNPIAA